MRAYGDALRCITGVDAGCAGPSADAHDLKRTMNVNVSIIPPSLINSL
jgi:hypothetical protein